MNLAEEAVTDSKTIIEIQSFKNFVFLSNHLILFAKKKKKYQSMNSVHFLVKDRTGTGIETFYLPI